MTQTTNKTAAQIAAGNIGKSEAKASSKKSQQEHAIKSVKIDPYKTLAESVAKDSLTEKTVLEDYTKAKQQERVARSVKRALTPLVIREFNEHIAKFKKEVDEYNKKYDIKNGKKLSTKAAAGRLLNSLGNRLIVSENKAELNILIKIKLNNLSIASIETFSFHQLKTILEMVRREAISKSRIKAISAENLSEEIKQYIKQKELEKALAKAKAEGYTKAKAV